MPYETKVTIEVQDVRERGNYEVLFTIDFNPGIPELDIEQGKKSQIGYQVWVSNNGHEARKSSIRHEHHTPIRPAYFLDDRTFKLVLTSGDNAKEALKSIAHIVVQSQGESELKEQDVVHEEPDFRLTYGKPGLEEMIKRI